ncbi:hypothetical protein ACFSKU_02670 [Pontibacter silvestris]|uniref:Phosphoribosylpyrophosphate synthetase n=1 Tax=Pontibacter silvestris TaxID=2305183 RepID=A0ABW4WTW3_9BACT|nr:hypothetical protein [Pontibacter silvestris]MCC9137701.1 hypothetical protein [Pontibacter silvestris]
MQDKVELTSMVNALSQARKDGYLIDFKVSEDGHYLCSMDDKERYAPNEVRIVNFYRFEGESNPDDMAILYLVETSSGSKGSISDAYGTYSDENIEGFMKQVEDLGKNLDKHS